MMHTDLNPESAKDGLKLEMTLKKISVQASLPNKFFNERLATPRVRSEIFVNEDGVLRNRKPSIETEVLASPLANFQKPWPSRKDAEEEELVKYMSTVPCYLQRVQKADSVQEKALNFGVIDWSRLEKWTSNQKTGIRDVASSSCSSIKIADSSCTLTNQSCSYSGSSTSSSAQRTEISSRSCSSSPVGSTKTLSLNNDSEEDCSIEGEKLRVLNQQSSNHGGIISAKQSEMILFDNLQDRSCIQSKAPCAMLDDRKKMEVCNSFSGQLSHKISHQRHVSGEILRSNTFQSAKSTMDARPHLSQNGATSTKTMTTCKEDSHTNKSFKHRTDGESRNETVECISEEKRDIFSKHLSAAGRKWLNRASSVKHSKSSYQLRDSAELDVSNDKGNIRGSRSPLRRMLNSLLKPISDGSSGPITSLPIVQEHQNHNNITSSSKPSTLFNGLQGYCGTSQSFLRDDKNGDPLRQALVKLAWKNGQPLFMFSTNESSILVASMKRTNELGKEDTHGVYTIVMAQECRKKGGLWLGKSRNTKPNLLYDVAGHMEVSCSKLSFFDSKNLELSKQFVLFDGKPLSDQGCTNSVHSNQLAAIVLKAPYQKLNDSIYKTSCNECECENLKSKFTSLHKESFQVEKYPEYSRSFSISAILPSGIHGFSDTGKPSSLIERWKSGGSCDCGGWDEGCRLTVLADRLHNAKAAGSVQECQTPDDLCRIELFNQGGNTESKHALSLIAFKEGLYTVDFYSSITSLQAFAICIAILHSRNSIDSLECFAKQESLQDRLYENHRRLNSMQNNGGSTSFESNHPPSSPVGRS